MSIIESLQWRTAIKKFDTTKKVSEEDVETLLEAGNLSATSGGLQPFKMIVVRNQELREKLVEVSYGQVQVAEASHLIVFASETKIGESTVDRYIARMAEVRDVTVESLTGMRESTLGFLSAKDDTARQEWAARQTYIAVGTVLAAAGAMKIDAGPMEGFDPSAYQELLSLKEKNLMPVVIMAVGYRSDEDVYSMAPKVRKKRDDIVLDIT